MGFGIFQSFSRYAPIEKSQLRKRQLFRFVLGRGLIASSILIGLIILFSGFLTFTLPNARFYLILLSFLIISLYVFEVIKNHYRIFNLNKVYAYIEISHSILLITLGFSLGYLWGGIGYILALILSPIIISLYILIRYNLLVPTKTTNYSKKEKRAFWSYGIYTSLGGLTSQLIFSVDILTIGFLIKDPTSVALYKAASLIPFSLLFIPNGFIKTDLVKITRESKNKTFLKDYSKNYMLLFLIVSIVVFLLLHFFSNQIMLLFGTEYKNSSSLITVFAIGIVGAFVLRTPFGNILTAVGWSKINTLIAITVLTLDVVLNIILVNRYGLIGAAYSTAILLWAAGILSYIAFRRYLSTLD